MLGKLRKNVFTKRIAEKLNSTNFSKCLVKNQPINKIINMKNHQEIFSKAIKQANSKTKCVDEKIGL